MGQASSFVRGYGGADENASESSKEGIDKGSKGAETHEGSVDSANASNDVNGSAESQDEQKASADELANVVEAVVSPEEALTSQLNKELEKDSVSEGEEASKLGETEDVKKEVVVIEDKAQTALNLALEELGEPPERPLPGDCCGQGCDVCVWDTYNDELRDYLGRKNSLLKKSK